MAFPASHKTVFVLDHGPSFGVSCNQSMEFDFFVKTRQPGIIPLAPVSKSLWTCTVEAAIEYCRIVWDIFPTGRLIRFVISDTSARFLNSWAREEQNLNVLMSGLAQIGVPQEAGGRASKDSNVVHGLSAAIEALCQCSEIQHEKRTSMTESAGQVLNRGRVVCITSAKSNGHVRTLESCFHDTLLQHNKLAASSDSLMPIHHCQLVLIHTHPVTDETPINSSPTRDLSSVLSSEVHVVKSGRHLAAKLSHIVLSHYNLASTTVTGIPMKEEQNASSSANYDVEILHPAGAHTELLKTGFLNSEGVHTQTIKEGQNYETITLKWCTPRISWVELHFCIGAYRVTPVDVNSRPSSCLTNFLLSGRAVMLEMPRKSGCKILSHMLSSHGGELFIHTLGTGRSVLEDPPSISEGCGGRVTDYRINDFGEFMKENKVVPCKSLVVEGTPPPIDRVRQRLDRLTQYWPMVISHTTIFNMSSQLGPFLSIVTRESPSADDVLECKKIIYSLVSMESKGNLPVPSIGTRGKGPKREEQYRIMWNELEKFVRYHLSTVEHRNILDCLLECRKPEIDSAPATSGKKSLSTSKESDANDRMELSDPSQAEAREEPPSKRLKQEGKEGLGGRFTPSTGPQNLLSMWTKLKTARKHVEFAGRLGAVDGKAKLYANLNESNGDSQ